MSLIRLFNNYSKVRVFGLQNFRYSTKVYMDTHEWYIRDKNEIKIGLSSKAIELMNEIVYVEDEIDTQQVYNKGESILVIESVKAVSDMFTPTKCKILEINENLLEDLEELNNNPEKDENWILKLKELD